MECGVCPMGMRDGSEKQSIVLTRIIHYTLIIDAQWEHKRRDGVFNPLSARGTILLFQV